VLNAMKQVYLQLKIGTTKKSLVVVVDQEEFKFKAVIEEALPGVKVFAGTSLPRVIAVLIVNRRFSHQRQLPDCDLQPLRSCWTQ
jgi:hypothetical protein